MYFEAPRGGAGIEITMPNGNNNYGSEAPRGGAGIEIYPFNNSIKTVALKPLVEGLVLKSFPGGSPNGVCEAPRGGAGIEMTT